MTAAIAKRLLSNYAMGVCTCSCMHICTYVFFCTYSLRTGHMYRHYRVKDRALLFDWNRLCAASRGINFPESTSRLHRWLTTSNSAVNCREERSLRRTYRKLRDTYVIGIRADRQICESFWTLCIVCTKTTKSRYRSKRFVGHLRCYNNVVNGKFARFWKRSSRDTPCISKSKRNKGPLRMFGEPETRHRVSRRCTTGTVWRINNNNTYYWWWIAWGGKRNEREQGQNQGATEPLPLASWRETPQAQWGRRDMTRYRCKKWKAHAIPREAESSSCWSSVCISGNWGSHIRFDYICTRDIQEERGWVNFTCWPTTVEHRIPRCCGLRCAAGGWWAVVVTRKKTGGS